jgi:hypothetical protein
MSKKRIILSIAIFLGVIAATVGVLYLLNVGKSTDISRGVKPTDNQVFSQVNGVASLPVFSELPAEGSGWTKTSSITESAYASTQLTHDDACTIDISSQLLPNTQKDIKDFQLSRSLVETTAISEDGSASDPYVISVRSTSGDVDFYSALYNPKTQLVHSTGTTPTTQGGSKKREGSFTSYIAARVFANQIKIGDSQEESTVNEGIVSLGAMLPAVTVNYTCPTDRFDIQDALERLKQVKVDFTKSTIIVPATSGK